MTGSMSSTMLKYGYPERWPIHGDVAIVGDIKHNRVASQDSISLSGECQVQKQFQQNAASSGGESQRSSTTGHNVDSCNIHWRN